MRLVSASTRPPYGAHNRQVDAIVTEFGYRTILWNVDTLDWDKQYQPDKWVHMGWTRIRAREPAPVLNHDIHKTTADHLDTFVAGIEAWGRIEFEHVS